MENLPDYLERVTLEEHNVPVLVIKKAFFDAHYTTQNIGREEFCKKFKGISLRTIHQTYKYFYTKEERKKIQSTKIAMKQRISNSNAKNTGTLRKPLSKEQLESFMSLGYTKEKIAKLLNVAPQTVEANINFYGIIKPKFYGYEKLLLPSDIDDLGTLGEFLGIDILSEFKKAPSDRDAETMLSTLCTFSESLVRYNILINRVKRRLYDHPCTKDVLVRHRKAGSQVNSIFGSVFKAEGYSVAYELRLDNYYYDIVFLEDNLIVEINPEDTHKGKEALDALKEQKAIEAGYNYVVVPLQGKERNNKLKLIALQCLENLKLRGLLK